MAIEQRAVIQHPGEAFRPTVEYYSGVAVAADWRRIAAFTICS
jgi:hypothetical protein